ncbi:hypothetical protein BaRGS_00011934 [Batillaria attramentaria]|uniref:Secreted protein n=1 Tax=Batillaria attramentaria TaxID=370345 RepID=A0ABD0LBZ2_9CAEN
MQLVLSKNQWLFAASLQLECGLGPVLTHGGRDRCSRYPVSYEIEKIVCKLKASETELIFCDCVSQCWFWLVTVPVLPGMIRGSS